MKCCDNRFWRSVVMLQSYSNNQIWNPSKILRDHARNSRQWAELENLTDTFVSNMNTEDDVQKWKTKAILLLLICWVLLEEAGHATCYGVIILWAPCKYILTGNFLTISNAVNFKTFQVITLQTIANDNET